VAQIFGVTSIEPTNALLMGPSAISVPVKDKALEVPVEMSLRDIALWRQAFVHAASRATSRRH
jgi:2,4-dienoyl-CoA reductase-like NADH-dependent reductase (Old Yellow Enzyme family)